MSHHGDEQPASRVRHAEVHRCTGDVWPTVTFAAMTAITRDGYRLRLAAQIAADHLALGDPGRDERVLGCLDAETFRRLALIGREQLMPAGRAGGGR